MFVFEVLKHPQDPTFEQCVTFGKLNTIKLKLGYNLYHFMGCYGVPLLIMMFCYAKIISTIASSNSGSDNGQTKRTEDTSLETGKSKKELKRKKTSNLHF